MHARREDLKYASAHDLGYVLIWTANVITKIAKRLAFRQQITATAIVYLRRFYLKNSYCEADVGMVMGACIYVATKTEELPVHIKTIVQECRTVLGDYGFSYPSDQAKTAEMEFYLLEDLDCHLVIFHPYRSLIQLTGRDGREAARKDAMLDLDETDLQNAWYIINDTYRSELCLLHPPHIIALAAIYLALSLSPTPPKPRATEPAPSQQSNGAAAPTLSADAGTAHSTTFPGQPPQPPAPHPASTAAKPGGRVDPITFLATLNVPMPLILEVVQDLISLYALWREYDTHVGVARGITTAAEQHVVGTLNKMRQAREVDIAHPSR